MTIHRINLNKTLYVHHLCAARTLSRIASGEIVLVLHGPERVELNHQDDPQPFELWYVIMTPSGEVGLVEFQPFGEAGPLFTPL